MLGAYYQDPVVQPVEGVGAYYQDPVIEPINGLGDEPGEGLRSAFLSAAIVCVLTAGLTAFAINRLVR